jgi:DNA-directed RNA polymerase subunit B
VGDKLASPYSQKGVVVAIVPDEDMPTVAYGPCAGMRVDIVFNNHGIPTRMTGATTDAPLYGIYACKFGKRVNGTAFGTHKNESREQFIERMGGDGKVWMMNPKTGKLYPERIFVGCTSYMRLNHLVAEKSHARNGGPVDNYMQPKAGKAKNGGLRMGKMERSATEGHGAAEFTYERMFLMSDRSIAYVCQTCSSINGEPPIKGQTRGLCRLCNDPHSCRPVEIPYSTVVLLNYMKASGMPITLKLEPDEDAMDVAEEESEDEWTEEEGDDEEWE